MTSKVGRMVAEIVLSAVVSLIGAIYAIGVAILGLIIAFLGWLFGWI